MNARNIYDKILEKSHPSFGSEKVVYLFGLKDFVTSKLNRFIIVEASNPFAIITIERILQKDKKVSKNCELLSAIRDNRSFDIFNPLVESIKYVDFMTDIVDSERILEDAVTSSCFSKSITKEEREYIVQKSKQSPSSQEDIQIPPTTPSFKPKVIHSGDQSEKLSNILCSMGYKRPSVMKFVQSLGKRTCTTPLQELVREGLKNLAS